LNINLFLLQNSRLAATTPGCSQSLINNSSPSSTFIPLKGKIIPEEIFSVKATFFELTPNNQVIIGESLAWLDASVKERMECGDLWVIYAEVLHGNVLKSDSLTAVHHRKSGANY